MPTGGGAMCACWKLCVGGLAGGRGAGDALGGAHLVMYTSCPFPVLQKYNIRLGLRAKRMHTAHPPIRSVDLRIGVHVAHALDVHDHDAV